MTSEPLAIHEAVQVPRPRGFFEWFWRGQELRQARLAVREQSALEQSRLRHARATSELAGRVLEPVDPLWAEPAYWLSTLLYREAAYWALLAQDEALTGDGLPAVFAASPRSLLLFAADGESGLAEVERILLKAQSTEDADEQPEKQRCDAAVARAFVDALIRNKLALHERVRWVVLKRWLRTGPALVLLLAAIVLIVSVVRDTTRPTDLAKGKPWRLSSSAGECRPDQNSCLGGPTNIFFHTNHEHQPWFELDLQGPRSFSVVEIENRTDCCPDRAIPLVVEVSNDRQSWHEVGRRTEAFDEWRAEFPPQTARYVRTRVLRHSALHLVRLSVYE